MSYQPTIVGMLSDSLAFQTLINNTQEQFDTPIWSNYLTDEFSLRLEWKAVLGVMEQSPMASVIDFSSGKPIYVRPSVSKLNGEIPTFGAKWQMNKGEVREFLDLQKSVGSLGIDPTRLIDFLMPDIKRAAIAPHATIDRLFLEAISTGQMTMTATNNPKGVIWNSALDWGITKSNVAVVWSTANAATMTPITDIKAVVDASDAGFDTIKMSKATFNLMVNSTEFKNLFTRDFGVSGGTIKGTASLNPFIGVARVNEYFETIDLPMIEIIDKKVIIETKAGARTVLKPFADNRVSFSVGNDYGKMVYTYSNEEELPIPGKTYAKSNNVLISKYRDNNGSEFTESEFNAFPVINKAKEMQIMITDVAAS